MKISNSFIFIQIQIIQILIKSFTSQQLFYPPTENIALFKPYKIRPSGTSCGLEVKDTLCLNNIINGTDITCSSPSSLFQCDQSCPFGNVLTDLSSLTPLNVEVTNPCEIVKDYVTTLARQGIVLPLPSCSYYFDPSAKSSCNSNTRVVRWLPFSLETARNKPVANFYNSRTPGVFNSGFTLTLWFRQTVSNNG